MMRTSIRHMWIAATTILLLSTLPIADAKAAPSTKLVVKGRTVTNELPTITIEGRTLVPLRVVSEALEAEVKWDSKTSTATIQKWGERLSLQPEAKVARWQGASSDDQFITLETPAKLKNETIYVPLRLISSTFGYNVTWTKGEIQINSPLSEKSRQVLYRGSLAEAREQIIKLYQPIHYMHKPLNITITDENYDVIYLFPKGKALGFYKLYGDTIAWIELKDDFLVSTWQANLDVNSSVDHFQAFKEMKFENEKGARPSLKNEEMYVFGSGIFGDSTTSYYGIIDEHRQSSIISYKITIAGESKGAISYTLPGEIRTDQR
ncbi:stalk domain-containing protein [Paenibacillus sp. 1001270B_150601_E10]|uniref:stalk domain-containing protein n=1 Tax=Paenibacillus sp. 1001270B_150601_E10 TaxID=2787079 RepID=UPI00189D5438|nr:stalk domain-containing protein [Paenibacillus sp. 1001270B_150601_E10]